MLWIALDYIHKKDVLNPPTERSKMLYIDQYGNRIYANTVAELRKKHGAGGSRVSRMYQEAATGKIYHVGYVVGKSWYLAYVPMQKEVK